MNGEAGVAEAGGWGEAGALMQPPASPECSSNPHKDLQETHTFARAEIHGGFQKTQKIGSAAK